MIKSILNDILLLRNEPIEKFREYFHSIGCTIFDTILSRQAIPGKDGPLEFEPKNAVLYIVATFSEDSPLVILRQDDRIQKIAVCEFLGIPECFRHNLCNLVDVEVRKAVVEYMQQFCGPEFSSMLRMKIQYNDYDLDITNRNYKKDDGTYDQKAHGEAVKQMHYLAREIGKLEREFVLQNKRYEGIEEMNDWRRGKKSKNTPGDYRSLRAESNPHIE